MAGKDEIREKGGNLSIPLYVRAKNGKGSDATISRDQAIAHRQERAIASRHSLAELLHRVKEVDNQSARRYS